VLVRLLHLAAFLALTVFAWPGVALAAVATDDEGHEITAAPARQLLDADPGDELRVQAVFTNDSPDSFNYRIEALGLQAAEQGSGFGVIDASSRHQLPDWIELPKEASAGRIAARNVIAFSFRVRVPEDASPGAHGAAIVFSRTIAQPGSQTDAKNRVVLRASVAMQLVVTVSGDLRPDLRIADLDAPRFVWSGERPRLRATLENTGNTLQSVDGAVRMSAFTGRAAEDLALPAVQLLPEGRRRVSARWNDPPMFGWFRPKVEVSASGERYRRSYPLMLVVPPWWMLALIGAAIALPIVTFWRRRRRSRGPKR
jgi:hypothetical protein